MKVSRSFETSEYINPARHSTTQDDQNPHPTKAVSAIFLYTKAWKLYQTAMCEVRTPQLTKVHVLSDMTRSRVVNVRNVTAVLEEPAVFALGTVHEGGGNNHLCICTTLCPERLESYIKII